MISPESQIASVVKILKSTQQTRLWGRVILDIRDGHLIEISINQTLKPEKVLAGAEVYETKES